MSTVLDPPVARAEPAPAVRLRSHSAGVRLSFTWLGTSKTLTPEQKARAAETFQAEGRCLSAGKKLLDQRHPAFKAVTRVRNRATAYWKGISLPYPEPGLRLLRREDIEAFDERMRAFRAELAEAVAGLEAHYEELKAAARQRLGRLYNPADYPETLRDQFALEWDFPSLEPPDYLRQLHPELYRQECRRVAARFDEAVRLAEEAFVDELSQLVAHLGERLSGEDDGKPKVFRDSAVGNLREFFDRFAQLNVRSNNQLEELVEEARRIVAGVGPQQLRENRPLRQRVAGELETVGQALEELMVERPRRNILRRSRSSGEEAACS